VHQSRENVGLDVKNATPPRSAAAPVATLAVAGAVTGVAAAAAAAAAGGGCVVMYDDRVPGSSYAWFLWMEEQGRNVFDDDGQQSEQPYDFYRSILSMIQMNQRYAKTHNYTFRFLRRYPPFDADHPPYWMKVKLVYDALLERKPTPSDPREPCASASFNDRTDEYAHEYVMWLDTDACVHNQSVSLAQLFATHASTLDTFLLFSPDQPEWESYMCAGVFIVRNTAIAREFFHDWLKCYDASKWSVDKDGKWACEGEWAGPYYEQGSACILVQSAKYAKHVGRLPWFLLGNHNYKRPSRSFAMHFAGRYKLYIEPYIRTRNQSTPSPLVSYHRKD
jgi:hypothetical protein